MIETFKSQINKIGPKKAIQTGLKDLNLKENPEIYIFHLRIII